MENMGTAKLKNGSEELKSLVLLTMISLRNLIETNPIAFYELVTKCRDDSHRLFGNTVEVLKRFVPTQDERGRVHESIKNIVLSAAEGDGLEMTLGSPFADEKK